MTRALAAAAATWALRGSFGQDRARDPNRFALMADTHAAGDRTAVSRGMNMADNLQAVVRDILAGDTLPAGALIGGDCAYLTGHSEDYGVFLELLKPLREQGVPVHIALGNHDHRERFRQASGESERKASLVEGRHTLLVPSPSANWFILDSLDETNKTPGALGERQIKWLSEVLDRSADKPALIMMHHDPDEKPETKGLTDTSALFEAILPRRHVKALFYGHTHVWQVGQRDGLHLVNLPAAAYVFSAGTPNGWVDVRLAAGGMTLELRCLNAQHPRHGQRMSLTWRA